MLAFRGTRWFKCDLHLHTPASKCFEDKSVTPEQWVNKAIEKGLNCVAVTDHNTGEWIDIIKKASIGTGLIVYPGVEITCDTSKVHLIVLFELNATTEDVNDFLISCGINRSMFADQSASSSNTIFQIADIAHRKGALVIPAHIDEFNGLCSISFDNIKKLFSLPYLNAVQIIHSVFTESNLQVNGNEKLRDYLNDYYNLPDPPIDYVKIEEWQRPVKIALEKKLAIVTFSDNPQNNKNPKHGLHGIGLLYTWIKMDEEPSLEGLRQAFLLPDFRVRNFFISPNSPYDLPELWIKSISILKTSLTDPTNSLTIYFNPQLNTIIGGRGSGKSSILRFIRGVFNRNLDIEALVDIYEDQIQFYRKIDPKTLKGVITDDSIINVEFVRNNIPYKIEASSISNSTIQTIKVFKYLLKNDTWIIESAESFIDFFRFEQYSQKQIYEIAQEPNSLRERIDNSIEGLSALKFEKEVLHKSYLEKSASIRKMQQQISGKGKIMTEISDLKERIKLFQQSGIANILTEREKFILNKKEIAQFIDELDTRKEKLIDVLNQFELPDFNLTHFDTSHSSEIKKYFDKTSKSVEKIKSELEKLRLETKRIKSEFAHDILLSKWKKDFDNNKHSFQAKKEDLQKQGIDDFANFEKLTTIRDAKEQELLVLTNIESNLTNERKLREELKLKYLANTKDITSKRIAFVEKNMQDDRVKVTINAFRNKNDFITRLRSIIQREGSFQSDVDYLTNLCFNGNVEHTIELVRKIFYDIKSELELKEVTGYFVNLVKGLPESQLDEIDLLWPEDEIEVLYKPTGSKAFKPLSTASAGQKTTAILTFILSQGNIPLILDQPEDDLDNRLVYELVVDRLRKAKEHRQIIVVTHNANIPVNGDSEYIISMDSESKKLKTRCTGSVEKTEIKKEICDVMEGGEKAFEMRSRRYKISD